ncbi:MAG: hypothetical protein LBH32_14870 [Dysgonamonadaceae bacterium]|jgi:uncharacterized protein YndB with AHSA1/START domain|nr:hypothetical protein [Dysgonamonadaceae bacterium]
MKKEKIHIEYVFDNASRINLWNYIGTSVGLAEWFADDVVADGKIFTFTWNKHSMDAEVTGINPNIYIRFRWLDEVNHNVYFEFRLQKNELTNSLMLEITDFAEPNEKEASITLWNTQAKNLRRLLGL